MKLRLLVAALALAGFFAQAPRASAEFLTLTLARTPGDSYSVNLANIGQYKPGATDPNINNVLTGPYYWNDVNHPPNMNFPAPITTFCIELTDTVAVVDSSGNPKYVFGVVDPATAPSIATNSYAGKLDNIKALYGNYYQPSWASTGFNGSTESTAFQLALWELVYETERNPKTVASGNFSLDDSSSAAAMRANEMLGGLSNGLVNYNAASYEIKALIAPAPGAEKQTNGQDQIIVVPKGVPAPPAVLLAGIGVLALVGRARLARKSPVA